MIANITKVLLDIFRYHKKKIVFFFASIAFGLFVLFPYDDLSDFITLKVTQQTQSNLYLQFDGLGFALLPQLGIQMENVVLESAQFPTLKMTNLGFAPGFGLVFGKPSFKTVAEGIFGGDATLSLNSSNELDTDGQEVVTNFELEDITLKELTKFLKKNFKFPVSLNGKTNLEGELYVDTSFKKQPKGNIQLNVKSLNIGSFSSQLLSTPELKLSQLTIVGNINEGKLFIKEGKIGSPKNPLHGSVTGDLFFEVVRGGKVKMGGYDLKLNLSLGQSMISQLGFVLTFIDSYKGIGEKYKTDTLNGVRYAMRLTARSMQTPPRINSY